MKFAPASGTGGRGLAMLRDGYAIVEMMGGYADMQDKTRAFFRYGGANS